MENMDPPHVRHEEEEDHEEEGVVHSVSASVIAKTDQVRVIENMGVDAWKSRNRIW